MKIETWIYNIVNVGPSKPMFHDSPKGGKLS